MVYGSLLVASFVFLFRNYSATPHPEFGLILKPYLNSYFISKKSSFLLLKQPYCKSHGRQAIS